MKAKVRTWGFVLTTVGFKQERAVEHFVAKRMDQKGQGDGSLADKRLLTPGDRGEGGPGEARGHGNDRPKNRVPEALKRWTGLRKPGWLSGWSVALLTSGL